MFSFLNGQVSNFASEVKDVLLGWASGLFNHQ